MGFKQVNLALETEYSPTTKLILVVLAEFANTEDECFPSWNKLMERTSIKSRDTIGKHLKILEDDGVITRTRRFDTSNLYKLSIENAPSTKIVPSTSVMTRVVPPNMTRVVPNGQTLTTTEPPLNQQEKKPKKLSEFDSFLNQLRAACTIKSKVTKGRGKLGLEAFNSIEDKSKLFKSYIKRQEEKQGMCQTITNYMIDYNSVYLPELENNTTETDYWCRS